MHKDLRILAQVPKDNIEGCVWNQPLLSRNTPQQNLDWMYDSWNALLFSNSCTAMLHLVYT